MVLPLNSYVTELCNIDSIVNDIFVKTKPVKEKCSYFSVIKIYGIDIFNYKESDQNQVYWNYAKAVNRIKLPHKIIFMNSSPVLSQQKDYINYRLKKVTQINRKSILERQINRFDTLEKNQRDRLAYLLIFSDGEDIEGLATCVDDFCGTMIDTSTEICKSDEIKKVLASMLKMDYNNINQHFDYDNLAQNILPDGAIFHADYMQLGNKYATSLVVHNYPSYLPDLLFADIFSNQDTLVVMDVNFRAKDEIKSELKSSMNELSSRRVIENSNADAINTEYELDDLMQLYTALERGNEQIVSITLRFYFSADSLEDLKLVVDTTRKNLGDSGIDTYVPLNGLELEYRGLTKPSNIINQSVPLHETFTRQFPYYYQSLIDESGLYAGQTNTGGQVIINTFKQTKTRVSYDLLLIGVKGSGKSATLKAMIEDEVALGHKVLAIDIDGEYGGMARHFGGKVIKIGKGSMINPLELRKMVDENVETDGTSNFAMEISRIETFMYQYIPSLSDMEAEEFKAVLQDAYKEKGINSDTNLSDIPAEGFPIFSDVLNMLRRKLYKSFVDENKYEFNPILTERRRTILEQLESYLKQLAEGVYSSMFNGYSTISINDEDFVVFNVKDLAEMGEKTYNAQLFNILSLIWNQICDNRMKNNFIKNEYDRNYAVAVIDEAHRFINAKNPQALDFIDKLERRARKYDAGLWFASQSILDFMPEGARENVDKVKSIFGLVQYKLLMKQSESSFETLLDVFPQFTESEIASTAVFEAGETLMSLGGGRQKIRFSRHIAAEDFKYFGGGREESINIDEEGN